MTFNEHLKLRGCHAFLGASQYHWLNYDEEKLVTVWQNAEAVKYGTELHDFAARAIRLGQKLQRSQKTLNMYVNDAIGFKMSPEVVLYYSDNCFGTTDAICFDGKTLRIHDLKTGVTPAKMEQLYIYAALFCLEYMTDPHKISVVCRIYQSNEIVEDQPDGDLIASIMDKIVDFDKLIDSLKIGE